MTPIRHILVATDFGESSAAAVDAAVFLAKKVRAILTVFHAYEVPVHGFEGVFPGSIDFMSPVKEDAEKRLAAVLAEVRKTMPEARSVLGFGCPWQGILDVSNELQVDLVVMGTHGRRGVARVVMGSVAEKTVRLSAVPVLTVPCRPTGSKEEKAEPVQASAGH